MNPIKLKAVARNNPRKPEKDPNYFLSVIHDDYLSVEELAKEVSNRCSLRRSDVQGSLIAVTEIIIEKISKGGIVSLGELGTCYINARSKGVETEEEISLENLNGFKLVFQPTKQFKKNLKTINTSLVKKK